MIEKSEMSLPMEAGFALLADQKIANLIRKIAWQADQKFKTGFEVYQAAAEEFGVPTIDIILGPPNWPWLLNSRQTV